MHNRNRRALFRYCSAFQTLGRVVALEPEWTRKPGPRHVDSLNDNSRRRLVEAADLAGPSYRDRQLVLAAGTKPATVRKDFAFANPELAQRMNAQ